MPRNLKAKKNKTKQKLATHIKKIKRELAIASKQSQKAITILEKKLENLGDNVDIGNIDMQNALQMQTHTMQMITSVSKMLYDTSKAVVRNVG